MSTSRHFLRSAPAKQAAITVALLLLTAVPAGQAGAQSAFGDFAANMAMNQMMEANRNAQIEGARANQPNANNGRQPAPNPQFGNKLANAQATPLFAISSALRVQNVQAYVANKRMTDPEGARRWQAIMATSQDPLSRETDTLQARLGLRSNNIVDVMTYWLVTAWSAQSDTLAQPTRQQFVAARNQMEVMTRDNQQIMVTTAQEKQSLADFMLLSAIDINQTMVESRTDAAKKRTLANIVRSSVRNSVGVDLASVELSDAGFQPKSAASARSR